MEMSSTLNFNYDGQISMREVGIKAKRKDIGERHPNRSEDRGPKCKGLALRGRREGGSWSAHHVLRLVMIIGWEAGCLISGHIIIACLVALAKSVLVGHVGHIGHCWCRALASGKSTLARSVHARLGKIGSGVSVYLFEML